jgi:hypothetical protein
LEWKEWQTYARYLRVLERGVHWWIGDLLIYADSRGKDWEENGIQFLGGLGFADQTLAQCKSVANQFSGPAGKKRHEQLSFEHHKAVAYLSPELAEELLVRAQVGDGRGNCWTTVELQEEIRVRRAQGAAPASSKIGQVGRDSRKARTKEAADAIIQETPAEARSQGEQSQPPADSALETVDGVYDFAEHCEIRTRAIMTLGQCSAALSAEQNDLDAGYEKTQAAIDVLVELRGSYENLGAGND